MCVASGCSDVEVVHLPKSMLLSGMEGASHCRFVYIFCFSSPTIFP